MTKKDPYDDSSKLYPSTLMCMDRAKHSRAIYFIIGVNGAEFNVSASHAIGVWFESRWLHSSFSLKSSDFVPVAFGGFPWNEAGEQ